MGLWGRRPALELPLGGGVGAVFEQLESSILGGSQIFTLL